MSQSISNELFWLSLTIAMTGIIWMPYIVNRLVEHGFLPALMNPQPDKRPKAQWAERLMRAQDNAVENLVLFAPLVLIIEISDLNSEFTTSICTVYFFARLAHLLLYTFGIPLLRTVAFFVGFLCQAALIGILLT